MMQRSAQRLAVVDDVNVDVLDFLYGPPVLYDAQLQARGAKYKLFTEDEIDLLRCRDNSIGRRCGFDEGDMGLRDRCDQQPGRKTGTNNQRTKLSTSHVYYTSSYVHEFRLHRLSAALCIDQRRSEERRVGNERVARW